MTEPTEEIVFGGDSVDIPPGSYAANLKSVRTAQSAAWGDFRAWDFELSNGSIVGGSTSMRTGSKSKAGRWITALLGRKPDKGEKVSAAIIGKPCVVTVIENDDGWPQVENVSPPIAAAAPQQAPAQVAPQPIARPAPTPIAATPATAPDLPF